MLSKYSCLAVRQSRGELPSHVTYALSSPENPNWKMAKKATRTQSKGAFTRSLNALRDAISTEAPTVSIDRKLQRMQECYQEVEKCHQAYQISLSDPDEDTDAWKTEVSTAFESAEVEADRLRERRLEFAGN